MPAPSSALERRIEFLVRSRLGTAIEWRLHDRAAPSPMNLALDAATHALGQEVQVVWVFGGYPQLFTLTGLETPIVVFSTRYLELTAYLRSLFLTEWMGELRAEIAERHCLTIAAELALLARDPDLAVRLFLRSKLETGIHAPSRDILATLEAEPISESYMVVWFFGLLHEVGHSQRLAPELENAGLLSAASLEAAMHAHVEAFAASMDADLAELLRTVRGDDPSHPLAPAHLRGEAASDLFATGVVLQATLDILDRIERDERFDPLLYIAEVYVYLNVITIVERCGASVRWRTAADPEWSDVALQVLEPAAIGVRLGVVREYLAIALAHYFAGGDVARADFDGWRHAVDDVMGSFGARVEELDDATGAAMRTILWDDEPLDAVLAAAASDGAADALFRIEASAFCAQAESLGVRSRALSALAALAG